MIYIGYGSFLLSCGSLDVYVDYDLVFRDKIVTDKVYSCDCVADVDDVDSSQREFQTEMKKMTSEPSVRVVFFFKEA